MSARSSAVAGSIERADAEAGVMVRQRKDGRLPPARDSAETARPTDVETERFQSEL